MSLQSKLRNTSLNAKAKPFLCYMFYEIAGSINEKSTHFKAYNSERNKTEYAIPFLKIKKKISQ